MKTICSIVFLFGKKITAAGYFMIVFGISVVSADFLTEAMALTYPVNDTRQEKCYNDNVNITCPVSGSEFYGQDAQYTGNVPDFTNNGDGTVSDNNTGLIWQKSPDTDGDGDIDAADKLTWTQIQAYPAALNAQNFGGYSDWRVPSIKELYSLIEFSGTDPMVESTDTSGLIPFIDTGYFDFAYGDTNAGERVIDSQYASDTLYVSTANGSMLFGVNFADGRIKGYGLTSPFGSEKTFFVICVRGNTSYGINNFTDNGDGTVTNQAAGLMWSQADSGTGMTWLEALAWIEQKNAANHLGYSDWRMPNAKELQSIVDYTRSPDTTGSAAIDPVFSVTSVTNEAGQTDYPFYWSGTTHVSSNGMGGSAVYVAFGRAMGYMNNTWVDVHGAGAQRSDPKSGNPADYPTGRGPQGDAIHIYNYVRCVRDAEISSNDTGSLTVNIEPADAVSAGAQWKTEASGWQETGATLSGLAEGSHTVVFKTVDGWTPPVNQTVTVTAEETLKLTGIYTQNTCIIGDIDGDGFVDISDAIIALQILVMLNPAAIQLCSDVNNDGKIGPQEAVYILHKISGIK